MSRLPDAAQFRHLRGRQWLSLMEPGGHIQRHGKGKLAIHKDVYAFLVALLHDQASDRAAAIRAFSPLVHLHLSVHAPQ